MANDSTSETPHREEAAEFEKRHEKELGAKTFVQTKAMETFIPLGSMAAGGFIGYHTLGKPLQKLFPKKFGIADLATDIVRSIGDITTTNISSAFEKVKEIAPQVLERAQKAGVNFKDPSISTVRKVIGHAETKELEAIKTAFGVTSKTNSAKWVGAAVLGFIGSMIGGIFVGYGKWKKEESTRLAAAEINQDISRLEVLGKRDPELVAENKRLRAMLEQAPEAPTHHAVAHHDTPTHHVGQAEHHGAVHAHEHQLA